MSVKFTVTIPFGIGKIEWTPSTQEKEAAWSLYVEYSTRITGVKRRGDPKKDFGSARLAMDSLYNLMNATWQVLREAGPAIAKKPNSLGPNTIRVHHEELGSLDFPKKGGSLEEIARIKKASNYMLNVLVAGSSPFSSPSVHELRQQWQLGGPQ
jgi:hypothetical protein